jgi:hypothetical protein
MIGVAERRSIRSADPLVALTLMLDAARSAGKLSALAVSDSSGCLVAGSGAVRACEELAALAPLWAKKGVNDAAPLEPPHAEVQRLRVDGVEVLLAASGDADGRSASLLLAAQGCRRILGQTR